MPPDWADDKARHYFEDWDFTDDAGPEHEQSLATALRDAHARGQREMRERAAMLGDEHDADCRGAAGRARADSRHGDARLWGQASVEARRIAFDIRALEVVPEPGGES